MQTKFQIFSPDRRGKLAASPKPASVSAALPSSLTFSEAAAGQLRTYLDANGLKGYRIFYCANFDLADINDLLPALGEADCAWEPVSPQTHGGHTVSFITYDESHAWEFPTGFLRLFRHEAVIGRWYWHGTQGYNDGSLWLVATPSAKSFASLRRAVLNARRESNRRNWQIHGDGARPSREMPAGQESLVLNEALRERVRSELLGFFEPEVAAMYRAMAVPYRRGVLLYGPPGNGKTSLIRWIGASLPQVAAISLRAWPGFDSDDLISVLKQWIAQAPALLVLEDLDWLLEQVNVSTFLNQLDGLATPSNSEGLLLLATTNHPEKLDPAVNNRPGRFDTSIELLPPEAALRERFLKSRLPELSDALAAELVAGSDGLSFAHLQELLRLSGLRAIHGGRSARSAEDLTSSLADVKASHDMATKGFSAMKLDMPFGLSHLHKK